MLVAVGAFACMDSLLKFLAQHYPAMQVSAMRGFASLPFILVPLLFSRSFAELKPVRWKMHLIRGLLSVFVLGMFVYAIRVLSLADAYAAHRDGFVGAHSARASGVATLACDRNRAVRRAGDAEAIAVGAHDVGGGRRVRVGRGVCGERGNGSCSDQNRHEHQCRGALAVHMLTQAFRSAPVSVVAPFEYTALLWGVGIDWLIWNTLPDTRFYLGGSIVIASGLFVIWRETRAQVVPAQPAATATAVETASACQQAR
jgi:hypothetical protein